MIEAIYVILYSKASSFNFSNQHAHYLGHSYSFTEQRPGLRRVYIGAPSSGYARLLFEVQDHTPVGVTSLVTSRTLAEPQAF